jgi:RNA polymerase sigma factor (TIGR02999 family)
MGWSVPVRLAAAGLPTPGDLKGLQHHGAAGAKTIIIRRSCRLSAEFTAAPEMMERVYSELRRLAGAYLRHQRRDHTLQPTALVHEAYLRMAAWDGAPWHDRTQFIGVAALVMRQVLTMHARKRAATKRGGGQLQISLSDPVAPSGAPILDLLALDRALTELEAINPQSCRIVELRFFGGLSVEEIAECLAISPATVKRSWTFAKTWLRQQLKEGMEP